MFASSSFSIERNYYTTAELVLQLQLSQSRRVNESNQYKKILSLEGSWERDERLCCEPQKKEGFLGLDSKGCVCMWDSGATPYENGNGHEI